VEVPNNGSVGNSDGWWQAAMNDNKVPKKEESGGSLLGPADAKKV